jgi:hypothetical protein
VYNSSPIRDIVARRMVLTQNFRPVSDSHILGGGSIRCAIAPRTLSLKAVLSMWKDIQSLITCSLLVRYLLYQFFYVLLYLVVVVKPYFMIYDIRAQLVSHRPRSMDRSVVVIRANVLILKENYVSRELIFICFGTPAT